MGTRSKGEPEAGSGQGNRKRPVVGRAKVKAVREAPAIQSIEGVKPWQQLPSETAKGYAAFVVYRDIHPGERSQQKAADKLGKSLIVVRKWASRNNWTERVRAWDGEVDRQRREVELAAVRDMRERHVKISLALQGLSVAELNKMHAMIRKRSEAAAIRIAKGEAADDEPILTPDQFARIAELGIKLERLNRELPETIVQQKAEHVILYLPDNQREK